MAADPSAPPFDRAACLASSCRRRGRSPIERRNLERLRADGVRYVVVSGAVADRVRAAAAEYPREVALLRRAATAGAPGVQAGPRRRLFGPLGRGVPPLRSGYPLSVRAPCVLVLGAVLLAVAAGCSGSESEESSAATPKPKAAPDLPRQVARRLAAAREPRRGARVLPDLDAEPARRRDRRPVELRRPVGEQGSELPGRVPLARGRLGDVHVNFRAYPGSTKIPRCMRHADGQREDPAPLDALLQRRRRHPARPRPRGRLSTRSTGTPTSGTCSTRGAAAGRSTR